MKKRIISLLLLLCMLIAMLPVKVLAATEGYYTYSVSGGKATITAVSSSVSGTVTIPSTLGGYPVTSIGYQAFYVNNNITSVIIPDGVVSIGTRAFCWCKKLVSVTIPDSVTSIGNEAFRGCDMLTSVDIPDSVISMNPCAFENCIGLTSVKISGGLTLLNSGVFNNCPALTSVVIPDGVTNIKNNAFKNCTSLSSIFIPDSVTSIEYNAFKGCTGLSDVYFSGSEKQFSKITIGTDNGALTAATIHYNYSPDEPEGDHTEQEIKRVDGFNFYINYTSNYISVGMTVELHVGYYVDGIVDESTDNYVYTNSNNQVLRITDKGWSNRYGQKLTLTALHEGSSVITVTDPGTGESAFLDIYVSPRESVWNFYNIPKLNIEEGKVTNFYCYSDMVVDEFSYKEHIDDKGELDYYTVTMTVWNSANIYGAVTSHYQDGSLYAYQIIDKKDVLDTSFVSSLQSAYYAWGDLFCLLKNEKYYSGKSITTKNEVEIIVPSGGYLHISNNAAASELVSTVNYVAYVIDVYNVLMDVKGLADDWDKQAITDFKQIVIPKLVKQLREDVSDKKWKSLQDAIFDSLKSVDIHGDNIQETVLSVARQVGEGAFVNFFEELEEEICSAKGIASLGEGIMTEILPTGIIIDSLYTSNAALEMYAFQKAYYNSINRPTGIVIYAPAESSKFVSNGINVDTQEDTADTVIHAYTVTDTGKAGINENTFFDSSVYYADRFETYNITLYKNGIETQPQSTVTVRIPIPSNMNKLNRGAFKVYRNNDDGTLTDMNAWVEGDYMVFETDHFSYYSIVDETAPQKAEDLKFAGASLTLQDALTVNYKVNQTLLTENGYEAPYVRFQMNDVESVVKDYHIVDDKLVFDFDDVAPDQMNDTICATLYAQRDGVTYESETRSYSVREYCYTMLGKCSGDEYAKLRTLLIDILHYGTASQNYTGYRTDMLANDALTTEQLAWGSAETPVMKDVLNREYDVIDDPKVNWKGAGLNLLNSVSMRFKIQTDGIEDLSVKITNDAGENWVIYSDRFEVIEGGCYVYFDALNADEMSQTVYLTVYDGLTPVSNTIRYSIESYAASKQNDADADLSALVIAMMKYGNSAYSYVN